MKNKQAKSVQTSNEYTPQWRLHQNLGKFAAYLDRQKDTAEIGRRKLRAAPVGIVEMVF